MVFYGNYENRKKKIEQNLKILKSLNKYLEKFHFNLENFDETEKIFSKYVWEYSADISWIFMDILVREIRSWMGIINLVVNRSIIVHLSLYAPLTPTCGKKISIMGRVYIINQRNLATKLAENSVKFGQKSFLNKFWKHLDKI